jgi:MscS family membrane protein
LGLGGLAFALAAKDLLGNFFGSLTVLLDRPFQIGDWVVIDDVEGSVEEVGFRTTKVRTFYNSLITLPNSVLTNTKIDNMGARRFRRMNTMLGLTYDTSPEKIDAFCEGVRALIQLHPYMRKDYYQVYFNQYSAASLDILIYVFWETPDWNMELRERHRFLLDILRLAKQLDVEFAYPTQTLYLKQGEESVFSESAFSPMMTEADAFAQGQKEARSIVEATTGLDAKPGRVQFPQ